MTIRMSQPALLLKLEGAAMFLASVYLYAQNNGSWLLFIVLLFAPDLSMLGYLAGERVGANVYNVVHTYALPAVLLGVGMLISSPLTMQLAFIWLAHIGLDRVLGYGLKYPSAFKDTHLSRV